jgi:hypothetical protein
LLQNAVPPRICIASLGCEVEWKLANRMTLESLATRQLPIANSDTAPTSVEIPFGFKRVWHSQPATSWATERRVIARFEATTQGFDARYIVTTMIGEAQHLYENVYCQRRQAENLIKMHKVKMASDAAPGLVQIVPDDACRTSLSRMLRQPPLPAPCGRDCPRRTLRRSRRLVFISVRRSAP